MNNNRSRRAVGSALPLLLAGLFASPTGVIAAEYWLQTGTTTLAGVPMWGYALCGTGSTAPAGCAGAVTVPGPALAVPPGEGLIVHLHNTLPEPTSLVIAGQVKQEPMEPVWFEPGAAATAYHGSRPAGNTTARVRSFDREADAGGGSATFTWAAIRPGTYLYSSGTHRQTQVQMGLYGALTKDAGLGKVAYSSGATNVIYANQLTLVYSEVDPALHTAVASGTYGHGGPNSTLDYRPKYFLINGKPYPAAGLDPVAIPTLPAGEVAVPAGSSLLIRFLNAGLKAHVPTINGQYWQVIAEDGNPAPYLSNPRQQYTAFLPPSKTLDVLLTPTTTSTTDTIKFAVFDSRLFDTTDGNANGGMQFKLAVAPAVLTPPVFDSAPVLNGVSGVPYNYTAHATASGGHSVQYSVVGAPAGMTVSATSGLLNWAVPVTGSYPLTVRATDQAVPTLTASQPFTLVIGDASPSHAPVAAPDTFIAVARASTATQMVAAPGVLANDTDAAGHSLTALKVAECTVGSAGCVTSNRVTLNANGGFTLISSASTNPIRVTYRAQDGSKQSADTLLTVSMVGNRAPTVAADAFTVPRCTTRVSNTSTCRTGTGFYTPASLNLVANDADPDTATADAANQVPLAVARVRAQASGNGSASSSATAAQGMVTITGGLVQYVPRYNFTGTDSFQYRIRDRLGKESGSTTTDTGNLTAGWATVTITVQ